MTYATDAMSQDTVSIGLRTEKCVGLMFTAASTATDMLRRSEIAMVVLQCSSGSLQENLKEFFLQQPLVITYYRGDDSVTWVSITRIQPLTSTLTKHRYRRR